MTLVAEEYLSVQELVQRYDIPLPYDFNQNQEVLDLIGKAAGEDSSKLRISNKQIASLSKDGQYVPVGYYVFTDAKRRVNKEVCQIIWSRLPVDLKRDVMASLFLDYMKDDALSGLSQGTVETILDSDIFTDEQLSEFKTLLKRTEKINTKYEDRIVQRYLPKLIDKFNGKLKEAVEEFSAQLSQGQLNALLSCMAKKEQKFVLSQVPEDAKKAVLDQMSVNDLAEFERVLYGKAKHYVVGNCLPILPSDRVWLNKFSQQQGTAINNESQMRARHLQRVLQEMTEERAVELYDKIPEEQRIPALKKYVLNQLVGERKNPQTGKVHRIQTSFVVLCVHPDDVALFRKTYMSGVEEVSLPEQQQVKDMLSRIVTVKVYPHTRAPANNPVTVTPGDKSNLAMFFPGSKSYGPAMYMSINNGDIQQNTSVGDVDRNRSRKLFASEDYAGALHTVCHTLHLEHDNAIFHPKGLQPYFHKPFTRQHTKEWEPQPSLLVSFLKFIFAPLIWLAQGISSLFSSSKNSQSVPQNSSQDARSHSYQQEHSKARMQSQEQEVIQSKKWQDTVAASRSQAEALSPQLS